MLKRGECMYYLKVEDVLKKLDSTKLGLSSKEAKKRLLKNGPNVLPKGKSHSPLKIFLSQFKNGLILLLFLAGFLSLSLGEHIESYAIFFIIFLNAVLGFVQEYRAEKAMEALKKISAPTAVVFRDGKAKKIPAAELTIGDILVLEAGDIVAADSRIIEQSSLQIDEASLTGESIPSKKTTEAFKKGTHIGDQENMAFMGTVCTYGKALCIVTSIGINTEFGKIAHSLTTETAVQTPLQKKFTQLAKQIGIVAVILIIIVLVAGTMKGTLSFAEMLLFALALTVSTIPNSLPIIVTVSLSMGANRLAKKNMLMKKLPAAESLGAATVICSDKTGTLTKNQMTVTRMFFDKEIYEVSGTGYKPEGNFFLGKKQLSPKKLDLMLKIGYLCNNSKLIKKNEKYAIIGDPTEGALKVLGEKGKVDVKGMKLVEELPFDSDRKLMSVIFGKDAYVKGAPDLLLKKCTKIFDKGKIRKMTAIDHKNLLKVNEKFANDALRVLGFGMRDVSKVKKYTIDTVEKDLVFVGMVGMIDPPRDEVKHSIELCKKAGIKVIVITGDQAITTKAVASKIGLFTKGDLVITGEDVEKMSDKQLEAKIDKISIIARALPIQKLRIVEALKRRGHVVAMTGDGVNDAPALKRADIGIAMGITGTDVAKEVADAVLIDDNFSSIVNAIAEGRNIYDKMIKSAKYLLSCNAGEITSVFVAIMLGLPLPLLPLQLLLMNLLTDDFPALGLGFEKSEEGIMDRPPRDPKLKPITLQLFGSIVAFGIIMGLGTMHNFYSYLGHGLAYAQTVAFTTLVMFQMFAVLSSRSLRLSLKDLNPLSNKWLLFAVLLSLSIQAVVIYWAPLQLIFGTVALAAIDWFRIMVVSSAGFVVMELSKVFVKS